MLTCSTAWATLSIRYSCVGTWNQGAGDLATHCCRVLQSSRLSVMSRLLRTFSNANKRAVIEIPVDRTASRCITRGVILDPFPCNKIVCAWNNLPSLTWKNQIQVAVCKCRPLLAPVCLLGQEKGWECGQIPRKKEAGLRRMTSTLRLCPRYAKADSL